MQESRIIRTKDGKEIHAISYTNGEPGSKVIIIGPSADTTQVYYRPLAKLLRSLDYDVVTFDYRGTGQSAPPQLKGFKTCLHQWAVQDADAVIRFVKNHFVNQEIIYIGHGISGEIIGLAQASQYIQKLVLVSSALSCKKIWPLKHRLRIIALKTIMRLVNKLFGYFPGTKLGILKDIPKGVAHQWANWCSNTNGLFDAYPDNNFRKLQVPLLAFSFTDDWRCPPKAVEELLNRFTSSIITWHHILPRDIGVKRIGHSGFFDPYAKPTLWVLLEQWINGQGTRHEVRGTSKVHGTSHK